MASKRCGCASDSCACVVEAGSNVQVEGDGTKTFPYVISAASETANLTVEDEDTLVRAGVALLNFKGAGVSTAAGGTDEVIVTVPAGVTGITATTTVYTANATWTKPTNCLFVEVEVQGGGGSGGGAAVTTAGQGAAGGGGGAGGYTRKTFNASELDATETLQVGAGGAAGAVGAAGNNGADSFFAVGKAYQLTGGQGVAGSAGVATATNAVGAGGLGGSGSGGTVNIIGGAGSYGRVSGGDPFTFPGGGSLFCGPRRVASGTTSLPGTAGLQGAGGTGAMNFASQGAAISGGAGGTGLVVITSYIKV